MRVVKCHFKTKFEGDQMRLKVTGHDQFLFQYYEASEISLSSNLCNSVRMSLISVIFAFYTSKKNKHKLKIISEELTHNYQLIIKVKK